MFFDQILFAEWQQQDDVFPGLGRHGFQNVPRLLEVFQGVRGEQDVPLRRIAVAQEVITKELAVRIGADCLFNGF
ncbi:hypothetical protein D3C81_2258720 [compost metagenome]